MHITHSSNQIKVAKRIKIIKEIGVFSLIALAWIGAMAISGGTFPY